MTVLEVIQRSAEFLARRGVDSPRLQIESILAHVLALPRLELYLNFQREVAEVELQRIREMVKRRGHREPLQHIVGSTSFCGLQIKVTPAALIPRPETEILAERAWQFLSTVSIEPAALDVGTGTGCIAIAVATNAPAVHVTAIDTCPDALALAKENAALHDLSERIDFRCSDAFIALPGSTQFDLIVSNPPYIPSAEIASLQSEVRDFDPKPALDGGADGLDFYRRFSTDAPPFLKPGGRIMLELGDGQAPAVEKIFSSQNWIVEEIVADYSSRPRILIARRE